ncbi:hypothetical protein RND71_003738 [Anisodus tanguticus]|uniref:Uncharacterized protein n=1 Tax=Anisodus tanguticus TaxID=243964 RepID=A0AAE1SWI1_9SOLA|nr:hypothetical protein RND71_003738 [Anisodus tanguticus]
MVLRSERLRSVFKVCSSSFRAVNNSIIIDDFSLFFNCIVVAIVAPHATFIL